MIRFQPIAVTAIIFLAALSRLLPHTPNVAPIAAMALFGGAYASSRAQAFLIPIMALFVSDLVIGFYPGMFVVYAAMMAVVCIGLQLRDERGIMPVVFASVMASILFFAVTNCVWLYNERHMYPYNWNGMVQAYTVAIPFFRHTVLGDLFYTGVLFGGYALLRRLVPARRTA